MTSEPASAPRRMIRSPAVVRTFSVMPFGFVPRVITAETVKGFPAVEQVLAFEYGVYRDVSMANVPLITPAEYVLVPSPVNEMDAEPLFAPLSSEALGCVSKSHQIVGSRPVTSGSAARAAGIEQSATVAHTTATSICFFIQPPIHLSPRFYQKRHKATIHESVVDPNATARDRP